MPFLCAVTAQTFLVVGGFAQADDTCGCAASSNRPPLATVVLNYHENQRHLNLYLHRVTI